jgi:hypothetical protein
MSTMTEIAGTDCHCDARNRCHCEERSDEAISYLTSSHRLVRQEIASPLRASQ